MLGEIAQKVSNQEKNSLELRWSQDGFKKIEIEFTVLNLSKPTQFFLI